MGTIYIKYNRIQSVYIIRFALYYAVFGLKEGYS